MGAKKKQPESKGEVYVFDYMMQSDSCFPKKKWKEHRTF